MLKAKSHRVLEEMSHVRPDVYGIKLTQVATLGRRLTKVHEVHNSMANPWLM
jgi:hypothetical protein